VFLSSPLAPCPSFLSFFCSYVPRRIFFTQDIPLGDITAWKMFYGVSLFAFVLRSLRVLAIFRKLGLLVLVFQRMMVDVASWLVVFLIFTLSFSVLLYDAGNMLSLLDVVVLWKYFNTLQ
jgi:hypothetical protein